MKSTLALSAFFVAVGVATDLCGEVPCVENSVLLQNKHQMTGPEQLTPVKAKESQTKSDPKSILKNFPPVRDCSCDKDKAFIMTTYTAESWGGYWELKLELEKYIIHAELLEGQDQVDFQLPQRFPDGTPGPCLYFVYFAGTSPADLNFLKTRATTEGATVLLMAADDNTIHFIFRDFFPGASVGHEWSTPNYVCRDPLGLEPSSQQGTIAQALTAGIDALPTYEFVAPNKNYNPLGPLVLPGDVQVIWTDTTEGWGNITFLREHGKGMVIWDGTLWVYTDSCGVVPLPGDIQTYVKNLVTVTLLRACLVPQGLGQN